MVVRVGNLWRLKVYKVFKSYYSFIPRDLPSTQDVRNTFLWLGFITEVFDCKILLIVDSVNKTKVGFSRVFLGFLDFFDQEFLFVRSLLLRRNTKINRSSSWNARDQSKHNSRTINQFRMVFQAKNNLKQSHFNSRCQEVKSLQESKFAFLWQLQSMQSRALTTIKIWLDLTNRSVNA